MKDFDLKKECEKVNFDYSEHWEDEENENVKKEVDSFSKGLPRKGLKGKYVKAKTGRVSAKRIKNSYGKYFGSLKE
jgi:hypothetical protein